jgi:hypothetical protein
VYSVVCGHSTQEAIHKYTLSITCSVVQHHHDAEQTVVQYKTSAQYAQLKADACQTRCRPIACDHACTIRSIAYYLQQLRKAMHALHDAQPTQ